MSRDAHDYEKTEADLQRIQQNKDLLERTRAYFMSKNPDNFYEKISEDRKAALKEQVVELRKNQQDYQLQQLNTYEILDDFMPRNERFNANLARNEYTRAHAHDQLIWATVMTKFLVDLTPEELAKANERIVKGPEDEDIKENERL